jgi:superfamily II DNA or RNA helicase
MNYSAIRDNHDNGTVADFLRSQLAPDSEISVVSAYFTVYAYFFLREQFDSIAGLRFLFGEPTFVKSISLDGNRGASYQIEDSNLTITMEKRLSQSAVARACRDWLAAKAEIKSMVKPNFLHGKLYHIRQKSGIEKAIAGSSNFTVNGLGLGGSKNIELNLIVDSDRDRQELRDWFDSLWNDTSGLVEDVKKEVLGYLDRLLAENSPEFIYHLTLYHVLGGEAGADEHGLPQLEATGFFETGIWQALYDFQKDGVKGAINKILKHNGCIIADSVGLGKTYEALAVIKYFELLNYRTLVLCPKKLSGNWTVYQASQNHVLNPFPRDRFSYSVLYHTDLGRTVGYSGANGINLETFNWGAYDLVVIDESHNFRGNQIIDERADGSLVMNRTSWLMEKILKAGNRTRVLLLSATPVNNTLKDLRNQLYLITEGRDDALAESAGVRSLTQTLNSAQNHFTRWADPAKNPERSISQLLERLDSGFFKLLDELTIARSRRHIKNFYDLSVLGAFPLREKPISLYPGIDKDDRFPSYDRLNKQINRYKLSIFNPSAYLRLECQEKYRAMEGGANLNFTQLDRESTLIAMMKVNYLKRLESSIESFEISIDRTIRKIEDMIGRIRLYQEQVIGDEETYQIDLQDEAGAEDEAENEDWLVGKKLKFSFADMDLKSWVQDLRADREELIDLYNNAVSVTPDRDAKLAVLKQHIAEKILSPFNPGNRKVLVFTAFSDTAHYLFDQLEQWYRKEFGLDLALVSGTDTKTSFGRNDYSAILTNFSPRSKRRSALSGRDESREIELLIATDCISEGQNLQDCDLLINFDIHWNPVRIIQRFGRIDRLGSVNKSIRLINFWPTEDLDEYIKLKDRVESRMALVDMTATGEDNILNAEQIQELISEDLKYRDKQLKRLRDEVLDLEDMDASVSLTDFSLDDFRLELDRAMQGGNRSLAEAPLGLYALVPAARGEGSIRAGVVFCLRQKEAGQQAAEVNPLAPYFLAYVASNGQVRYNFTHAKQILEIIRTLCQGVDKPYEELCTLFSVETEGGSRMETYSELLRAAGEDILRLHRKREASALVSRGRGAMIVSGEARAEKLDHFELITWLIVREA